MGPSLTDSEATPLHVPPALPPPWISPIDRNGGLDPQAKWIRSLVHEQSLSHHIGQSSLYSIVGRQAPSCIPDAAPFWKPDQLCVQPVDFPVSCPVEQIPLLVDWTCTCEKSHEPLLDSASFTFRLPHCSLFSPVVPRRLTSVHSPTHPNVQRSEVLAWRLLAFHMSLRLKHQAYKHPPDTQTYLPFPPS